VTFLAMRLALNHFHSRSQSGILLVGYDLVEWASFLMRS
jgi:hypothetical protein